VGLGQRGATARAAAAGCICCSSVALWHDDDGGSAASSSSSSRLLLLLLLSCCLTSCTGTTPPPCSTATALRRGWPSFLKCSRPPLPPPRTPAAWRPLPVSRSLTSAPAAPRDRRCPVPAALFPRPRRRPPARASACCERPPVAHAFKCGTRADAICAAACRLFTAASALMSRAPTCLSMTCLDGARRLPQRPCCSSAALDCSCLRHAVPPLCVCIRFAISTLFP
jgi:hypothetical protein